MSPSIYVGQMPTLTDPQDTYLDPTTWSKVINLQSITSNNSDDT